MLVTPCNTTGNKLITPSRPQAVRAMCAQTQVFVQVTHWGLYVCKEGKNEVRDKLDGGWEGTNWEGSTEKIWKQQQEDENIRGGKESIGKGDMGKK